jgi:hypothetical protein
MRTPNTTTTILDVARRGCAVAKQRKVRAHAAAMPSPLERVNRLGSGASSSREPALPVVVAGGLASAAIRRA